MCASWSCGTGHTQKLEALLAQVSTEGTLGSPHVLPLCQGDGRLPGVASDTR